MTCELCGTGYEYGVYDRHSLCQWCFENIEEEEKEMGDFVRLLRIKEIIEGGK